MTPGPVSPFDVPEGEALCCDTCGCRLEAGHGATSPSVADMFKRAHTDLGHATFVEKGE